jgi:hypothetical protein
MKVECDFEFIDFFDRTNHKYVKKYSCVVLAASVSKPGEKIDAFIGDHKRGKTFSDVEVIQFKDTNVQFFPRGLNHTFPRLKSVIIMNCGLKRMYRKDLDGLESLAELNLNRNELDSLPSDLFINMKDLKYVRFSGNKIEFMDSKMLKPLVESRAIEVNFRYNKAIDAYHENFPNDEYPQCSEYRCSIKVLMKEIDEKCEKPIELPMDEGFNQFKNDFIGKLWETGVYSDFSIVADGTKEFHVHKSVLGIQSSVFAEIFNNNKKELKIESLAVESVEELLRFIYTGETSDEFNVYEVFALAAKFKIEKLKSGCEKMILHKIAQSEAFKVFNLGNRYSSIDLKRGAFEVIKKMFPSIKLPESWIDQPKEINKLEETYRNLAHRAESSQVMKLE